MKSLGSVFSFISEDLVNKINILLDFLNGENKAHYDTIQSMVVYEIGHGLVDFELPDKHPESGCRTLLRLHRALRWLQLFFFSLIYHENSQPSEMCDMAYCETLAFHQDRDLQQAAETAFKQLPERKKFFEVLNAGSEEQVESVLQETADLMGKVCEITGTQYQKYEMSDLP